MDTRKFLKLIFILKIIWTISVNGFIDVKLIQQYFKEKHTNYATIIGCYSNKEKIFLAKSLTFGKQRINFRTVNLINDLEFLNTTHKHLGVIMDGDCDQQAIRTLLIQVTKNVTKYVIEDVYNPASTKGGELKRRIVRAYDEKLGYVTRENDYKYWIRKNLTGVTLTSIIVLPAPFEGTLEDYLESKEQLEINTFGRFHHDTLKSCVKYYNYTPNVSYETSWGYVQKDGQFNGLVREMQRKHVDYGSSCLFMRPDRVGVIEYGRRTWVLRAAFIFRNPKRNNSVDVFTKPFEMSVWIALIFTAIFGIIFLKCTLLYERKSLRTPTESNWSYLVINTVAMLTQQGSIRDPLFTSARITIFFMLIISILIYQFYSAMIVSSLLMEPKTLIKSVKDLFFSTMKVGCEDTLYNKFYLENTKDKIERELYYKKILGKNNATNGYLRADDGLKLVQAGEYAFHVEVATAYPIISRTFPDDIICELREIILYKPEPSYMVQQIRTPFRDLFDTCLQRLAEYGILYQQVKYWHPKKPDCLHSATDLRSLSLDYFYPLFALLLIGIILSLIILLIELQISFRKKRRIERYGTVKMFPSLTKPRY